VKEKINITFCLRNQPPLQRQVVTFLHVSVSEWHYKMFNFPNRDIQGFKVPPAVAPYTIMTPLHFSLFLELFISYSVIQQMREKKSCCYETPASVTVFTKSCNQTDRIMSRFIGTHRLPCPKVICSYEDSQYPSFPSIFFFFFLNGSTALVGPRLFFSFLVCSILQSAGLLEWVISSSQDLYRNSVWTSNNEPGEEEEKFI
jgi:hypothetical protein